KTLERLAKESRARDYRQAPYDGIYIGGSRRDSVEVTAQIEIAPHAVVAIPVIGYVPGHGTHDEFGCENVEAIGITTRECPQAVARVHRRQQRVVLVQVVAEPELAVTQVVVRAPVIEQWHGRLSRPPMNLHQPARGSTALL